MFLLLESLWKELELDRHALTKRLLSCPERQLRFRSPAGWSATQIVDHLQKSETAMLIHSESKQRTRGDAIALSTRFRFLLMRIHFTFPVIKVKAPLPAILPRENVPLADILQSWENIRNRWAAYLDRLSEHELDIGIFKHPLVGPLTPHMTLEFQMMHARHHRRQIERIIRAAGN